MKLNDLKIGPRLGILVGALSALLVLLGSVGLYGVYRSNDALEHVYEENMLASTGISEIQRLVTRNRLLLVLVVMR
ncbi:MAG: Tar ligand binding domain-containing protein, partial [Hylemonella sp.]|nr:Tar ligand binding domain-containing protein [Hylemonella sp.]